MTEIVFTKGGTEAINLVAAGPRRSRCRPATRSCVTEMEHHANIVPWHFLRERQGVVLKWVAGDRTTARWTWRPSQALLGPRTKVVALTHMSNVLGTINPVAEIIAAGARGRRAGAARRLPGRRALRASDVQAIDCDFYVFTGHKLYGPTGIGVLYGKAERAGRPAAVPGRRRDDRDGRRRTGSPTPTPPHRFEAGTPPILEAIGLGAAHRLADGPRPGAVAAHEHGALRRVRERGWTAPTGCGCIGEAPGKGAILTFTVDGAHAHDVAQILDRYGVAVRAGTHCAEPLMQTFRRHVERARLLRPI